RWTHLAAGVMWIGHLWFFNFVNAQLAKTYDADSRKKVLPELMPRALYWFRWGAAYTFITGILLLFLVYWFGGVMVAPDVRMGPLFFFQAEDGIRDATVTGVQTCALPI